MSHALFLLDRLSSPCSNSPTSRTQKSGLDYSFYGLASLWIQKVLMGGSWNLIMINGKCSEFLITVYSVGEKNAFACHFFNPLKVYSYRIKYSAGQKSNM